MALSGQDITNGAAEWLRDAFGKGAGRVADYYADAFRGLDELTPIPEIARGVGRQVCRRYADNPDGVPGPIAAGFEYLCRPYLDDEGYGEGPELEKPFDGGQCPVAYGVTYETRTFQRTNPSNAGDWLPQTGFIGQQNPMLGPISKVPSGPGSEVFVDALGNVMFMNFGGSPGFDPNGFFIWEFRNLQFVRVDGQPDSCGNPPPDIRQPVPPPVPGPRVEPFNPRPEIDIDIDVDIQNDGDIVFDIGFGPVTISPFPPVPSGGGETPPGSGYDPGDLGEPDNPEDTNEDGEASGCAPANSVLVGVKINILPPFPKVSQYDDQVWRGVAYVYMGIPGLLALQPEGVAVRDGQLILAPVDYLTCWEVRANTGYNLRVTPYYREKEPQEV